MRRTNARVSMPSMADDAGLAEIVVQRALGAEVARPAAPLADDEPGQIGPAALDVLGVDAVVADLGIGHGDDLPAIRRVGEDLLIPGHRRVEADLAVDLPLGAERVPVKTVPSSMASFAVCVMLPVRGGTRYAPN